MFFHGNDMKSLHKHLNPSVLPENYGGTLPKLDYGGKEWYPCVENYDEHFRKWNDYGFANSN